MKVVIINKSDETGGAAVVSHRLLNALRDKGVDARMLVVEKRTDSPYIERAAAPMAMRKAFMAERLKIYIANGMNRATLFKVDTASDGLDLWRHRWVQEADVICLNWVNQGMLSLAGLRHIAQMHKPIIWTMHDLWCMTGICHHPGTCRAFTAECGDCPFLGTKAAPDDLSRQVWHRKHGLYAAFPICFVAVSRWLAERARESSLLREARLHIIPNAFPVDDFRLGRGSLDGRFRIVMGAARLDDTVKGLPILRRAMELLRDRYPDLARRTLLTTFGDAKDPAELRDFAVEHKHLGRIAGTDTLSDLYGAADCVVSTSLYETLPGTLIEGQACGAIPVSFDRGGQADIIEPRVTGWLAHLPADLDGMPEGPALDDAAAAIVEGFLWAAEQSKEIRPRLRDSVLASFSETAVADAYIRLFNELLAAKQP